VDGILDIAFSYKMSILLAYSVKASLIT